MKGEVDEKTYWLAKRIFLSNALLYWHMTKNADFANKRPFLTAMALALGGAISLGLARFSYGLFLPLMREDLSWTYLIAGTMNTANAGGYFIGALIAPWCFKKQGVSKIFIAAALITCLLIGLSGNFVDTTTLFALRFMAGMTSALVFVGGGVLAAQLGSLHVNKSGFLLGIYYGGTGFGIILSSVLVPLMVGLAESLSMPHPWQPGWWAIALAGFMLIGLMVKPALSVPKSPPRPPASGSTPVMSYVYVVLGYACFGMGYIGYMTFVIALLKQMGITGVALNTFYGILGLCVILSSRLWASMFDKYKGGQSMAILNTLLGIACFIPAGIAIYGEATLTGWSIAAVYGSGIIFGGCFLSAVASTTVFVKHNMPQIQWVAGITVFTSIFAFGQILGPILVGWISDGAGGLARGLFISGVILLIGAMAASKQRPLVFSA